MSGTRHYSRPGSRQASASGAVIGLPGTIDPSLLDNFDPALLDGFFDPDNFWAGPNGSDLAGKDFAANQIQFDLGQDYQHGLDLLDQAGMPYSYQNEAGQGPSELVPVNAYISQAFDPNVELWDPNYPVLTNLLDTTPVFSALPGGPSFMPRLPVPSQNSLVYPDPFDPTNQTGPYFQPPIDQDYTGYITAPVQQRNASVPIALSICSKSHRSSHKDDGLFLQQQPKRKRLQSDSGLFSSSSEEDVRPVKRPRQDQQPVNRARPSQSDESSRRTSHTSDSSSVDKPVRVQTVQAGEKPKKCEDKPWVRINNTTKGETTRTARINQANDAGTKYKTKGLPRGDWESSKFKFEYSQHYGLDEFRRNFMSARQIHEYITRYPSDNLRIWIQVTPADVSRRYASQTHSHCRFEKCPNRTWTGRGTIEVGSYRVAFDEKHKVYGKGVVDPYDCVGYAHLYCMERFLDFAGICAVADVRVDTRANMSKEPKGEAQFIFGKKHQDELAIVNKFLKAAQKNRLEETHEFAHYPVHSQYRKGERKPHEHTLVYALYGMNLRHRARSQMKQFIVNRVVKPGAFPIHRGDMEVKVVDKKIEALDDYRDAVKAGQKAAFDHSAYYDDFHPEINRRYAECLALKDQYRAEDNADKKRSNKRKIIIVEDSDDESHDQQQQQRSRSSPRKKQRVNYTEREPEVYSQLQQLSGYEPVVPHEKRPSRNASLADLIASTLKSNKWQNYNIDDYPPLDPEEIEFETIVDVARRNSLNPEDVGAFVDSLNRCKSSTNDPSASAMNSTRTASFNNQPVTSSKGFQTNDPPASLRQVATSPSVQREIYDAHVQKRSSTRLAGKT
ncbi:hypothetical protein EJ02DRAFT_364874, partial [Clathrospora elynae]